MPEDRSSSGSSGSGGLVLVGLALAAVVFFALSRRAAPAIAGVAFGGAPVAPSGFLAPSPARASVQEVNDAFTAQQLSHYSPLGGHTGF